MELVLVGIAGLILGAMVGAFYVRTEYDKSEWTVVMSDDDYNILRAEVSNLKVQVEELSELVDEIGELEN